MVRNHRWVRCGTVLSALTIVAVGASAQTAEHKTVVVLSFDQLAVMDNVHEVFGGEYDLGRGIAKLVRQRLQERKDIAVVESEATAQGSVAGTIVVFGKAAAEGDVGGVSVRGVRVGLGRKKERAAVMLEARLLDRASGETVTSVTGSGESERGEWNVSAKARGGVELAELDLSNEEFKKTSIGEATHKAVDELARGIAAAVGRLGTIAVRAPVAAPAPGPVMTGTIGTFAWMPYQFRGTEHFRFDVRQDDDGDVETGYYQLDLQPAGERRVRMSVAGQVGEEEYSSTVTTGVGTDGMQMGFAQFMTLGPIGLTLFNPLSWMMLSGHDLTVGDGWSYRSEGESWSVRVDRTCAHAGHEGVLIVVSEDDEVIQESCVARDIALPLRVKLAEGGSVTEVTLVEYRP
ncbi:MAG: CsgG/HfaB family protein [Gemmatimonadota bacterium]|nr:CsgG/HfaB family protein [Gemmatimonadota bacterium]